MNAANATWILLLDKSYGDGGNENSSRIFGEHGFDMQPPLHCAAHVEGKLNDPTVQSRFWSLEIAFPHDRLAYGTSVQMPPRPGSYWRINFSRVEWAVQVKDGKFVKAPSCQSCPIPGTNAEDNWVWSPQGEIAMHIPERWGYLQFSEGRVNTTAAVRSDEWSLRTLTLAAFAAMKSYAGAHGGQFTSDVAQLRKLTAPGYEFIWDQVCAGVPHIELGPDARTFVMSVVSINDQSGLQLTARIRQDRFLTVDRTSALIHS